MRCFSPKQRPTNQRVDRRVGACLGLLWLIEVSLFRCCLGLAWLGLALLGSVRLLARRMCLGSLRVRWVIPPTVGCITIRYRDERASSVVAVALPLAADRHPVQLARADSTAAAERRSGRNAKKIITVALARAARRAFRARPFCASEGRYAQAAGQLRLASDRR